MGCICWLPALDLKWGNDMPGRHERDFFGAAIEVIPPALQAIAAGAITFALTYAGHRYVPGWASILTLVLGGIVLLAASLWSWKARRLLLSRPEKSDRDTAKRLFAANSKVWFAAALASTLAIIGLSVYVAVEGLRPNPDFASPYDGTDPGTSPCVHSAKPILGQTNPPLRDPAGQQVGYVQLVGSPACATVWARVILRSSFAVRLKGDTAVITMVRPGDGARAEYPLLLHGGTIGFGNMLSDAQSCVLADVTIKSSEGNRSGPETATECTQKM
jgi:hypothetical protein